MEPMARPSKYSPELRERAVRLVLEHAHKHPSQWAAIRSVAEKIGCTVEALRRWVRQAEREQDRRAGLTTDERQRPPFSLHWASVAPCYWGHRQISGAVSPCSDAALLSIIGPFCLKLLFCIAQRSSNENTAGLLARANE